ncbi:MAG: cytochrome C [Thermodesulfobacteria bacterium]|nr:cytochrome C [Thermodesulfobacteriota bacterium]
MKNKLLAEGLLVLGIIATLFLCVACAKQVKEVAAPEKLQVAEAVAAQQGPSTPAPQADGVSLYQQEPRSLKPVECGSCHKGEYTRLKNSNSKHRFDCLRCHTQLHAYIPPKHNYEEIMPKCTRCHGLKHGKAFPKCLQCHTDPHSPLDIPFTGVQKKMKGPNGKMVVACEVCHWEPEGKQMQEHPCKHNTEEGCVGCHIDAIDATKHGMKPTCFDCHEPHVQGQTYQDCLVCHNPHMAKNILQYPEDTDNKVCGSCHDTIYEDLQRNHTKHSELHCAECHVRHGQIPKCQDCHGLPHGEALHKRFPNCLKCHLDPHNLPVLKKSE